MMIKDSLPLLKQGLNPNIMVISSLAGKYPVQMYGVYSMTKAALDNMVVWMAQELRKDKIRINAIAPGTVRTSMTKEYFEMGLATTGWNDWSEPDKIASVAATICSEEGSYMNGETY